MNFLLSTGNIPNPDHVHGLIYLKQVPVHTASRPTLYAAFSERIRQKSPASIFNINVHAFNLFHQNHEFACSIRSADFVICDSDIIRILSRFLTGFEPEKLTGSRWVPDFLSHHREPLRIYLLGDTEQVLQQCYFKMKVWTPESNIRFHSGFFEADKTESIIEDINQFEPDLLLVAMGMPKQELFLHEHADRLKATLRIPVGGAFRYWAGVFPQAPGWMLKLNMEWLHRIWLEPIRLFPRYLKDAGRFLVHFLR
ncbi:MAG: WecB/TagA/CpsF family glycosyltransferase [Bacteroidetes bacterium]|nr:WecB/TagA/CpsF family glycosyltransferase [Bacteroidota bacterium]